LTALLAASIADCVVLMSTSGLHPTPTTEAARASFEVVIEKPMAARWSDGLAMARIAQYMSARDGKPVDVPLAYGGRCVPPDIPSLFTNWLQASVSGGAQERVSTHGGAT
jgi:hypothetical protein